MSCARTCFRTELGETDPLYEALAEVRRLKKENEKLRTALAPFSCLSRDALRPGDFNKARRALAYDGQSGLSASGESKK